MEAEQRSSICHYHLLLAQSCRTRNNSRLRSCHRPESTYTRECGFDTGTRRLAFGRGGIVSEERPSQPPPTSQRRGPSTPAQRSKTAKSQLPESSPPQSIRSIFPSLIRIRGKRHSS